MSNIYTLEMDLDLKEKLNINTICKQFDTVHLVFSIFANSVQADLANYNIRLKAMKYDNIPLIQETNYTINQNVVTIIADEQLTTTSGKTLVELQFIDKTIGERKSTFNLVLNVVASTLEVNRTISTSTYTLLQELENKLDQAGDFLQNVKEAIDASNTLKTGIATATTLKSDLDNSISTGNTTKTNLETSITNANSSKTNLDTKNTEATANISTLTTKNNEASSNIIKLTELNQNATTLEQNLQSLDSENNKASSNIPILTTQNVNATQNISDLTSKNTTAETNKTNLDSANTQAKANIDALSKLGDVTGIAQDVTSLKNEITTARGTEANLGARLDKFNTSLSDKANQSDVAQLSNPNLIINGDFQIDQKNNYIAKQGSSYVIDRWFMWSGGTPPTLQSTKYSLLWTLGGNDNLIQMIELPARAKGKKLMLSFIVKGKSTTSLTITVNDSTSPTNGGTNIVTKTITCTGNFQYVTISVPATSFNKYCRVCFNSNSTNDVIELTEVKLEVGSIATPFVPRLYAEELALCKRYYQRLTVIGVATNNAAVQSCQPYPVEMRANPTITMSDNRFFQHGVGALSITASTLTGDSKGFGYMWCSTANLTPGLPYSLSGDAIVDAEIY